MLCTWFPWTPRGLTLAEVKTRRTLVVLLAAVAEQDLVDELPGLIPLMLVHVEGEQRLPLLGPLNLVLWEHTHMTSALRGGGGVEELPNFADEQY